MQMEPINQQHSKYVSNERFRAFLHEEMMRRLKKNKSYSLRTFAQFLNLDPGTLSQVVRGARHLSDPKKYSILVRLELEPKKIKQILEVGSESDVGVFDIQADAFAVISDWYHYAILELIHTKSFKGNARWIAGRLGINISEVNLAIERLVRLKMLKIDKGGRWHDVCGFVSTTKNEFTDSAFQELQSQLLSKALVAMTTVPFELRDQSSITLALDPEQLPRFKQVIKKFRRGFNALAESSANKSEIYSLVISLFPLTSQRKES